MERMSIYRAIMNAFGLTDQPAPARREVNQLGGRSHGFKSSPLFSRSNNRPNKYKRPHQSAKEKARRIRQRERGII